MLVHALVEDYNSLIICRQQIVMTYEIGNAATDLTLAFPFSERDWIEIGSILLEEE